MTDDERDDAARRWLARNLAWSRRLADYRDPDRWTRVVVTVSAIDRREDAGVRHDRVA